MRGIYIIYIIYYILDRRCAIRVAAVFVVCQRVILVSFLFRYSERSRTKCIGITIETRPDYCLKKHLSDMLKYGCTRLEIGVQSVYEDVARDTNR